MIKLWSARAACVQAVWSGIGLMFISGTTISTPDSRGETLGVMLVVYGICGVRDYIAHRTGEL